MRIKILVNFNGNVSGQSVRFHAGDEVDVLDEAAIHFVRGRYAEIINPVPAVKIVSKHAGKSGKAVK